MEKFYGIQILRLMRNAILLILLSISSLWANSSTAQSQETEIRVKSGTIASILDQISKQSHVEFFYNTNVLDVREHVDLTREAWTLEELLEAVLGDKYTYSIRDHYVMIADRKAGMQQTNVTVNGVVKDTNGKPVIGATVALKGTQTATATDAMGRFTLTVPRRPEPTLVITYIGKKPVEVTYKGEPTVQVVLEEDVTGIKEIVVNTGYQKIPTARNTGSTETFSKHQIENKGYNTIEDVLKGQALGVVTMSLSGRPGAQASIRIRGINSLDGDISPIWIVDGMPLQGDVPSISMGGTEFQETVLTSGIGNIPPDDIETITILRDAAATALYGAQGANGVIVVTTKRGTSGESFINVSSSYGITEAPKNRLTMMNTAQKMDFERGIYEDFPGLNIGGRVYQIYRGLEYGTISREEADRELARLSKINTNWFDEIFRTGEEQNHSVTLSGGDEKTQYYGNLSYMRQKGIIPNNTYDNLVGSVKLTHQFNRWLKVNFDVRSNVRNDRSTGSSVNPLDYATYANPYEQVYDENGNYAYDRSYESTLSQLKDGYRYNLNILEDLNKNTTKTRYLNTQMLLKLEIDITKELRLETTGTWSNSNSHSSRELIPGTYSSQLNMWMNSFYNDSEVPQEFNNGQLRETTSRSQGWAVKNTLSYVKDIDDKHFINLMVGQDISSSMSQGFGSMMPEWSDVYGIGTFPNLTGFTFTDNNSLSSLSSHTESQNRNVAFFGSGSYSYMDRYVVQGSIRFEGADIIGTDNQFSPLWNVSAKWNLHNEAFMQSIPVINQLALRASYGVTGKIDRNALPFSYMRKVGSGNVTWDGEKLMDRLYSANPSVKWQRTKDTSIGLDISMLNHRVNMTVNYYNKLTDNVLGDNKIPASTGKQSIMANLASIRNWGWELSLRTINVKTRDFTWTTSFNIAWNRDKVLETYYQDLTEVPLSTHSAMDELYRLYVKGEPIRAFYGYSFAGIDPHDGGTLAYINGTHADGTPLGSLNEEGRYVFNMDHNGNFTTQYLNAARVFIGRSDPPLTGGFSTQFNYKRWSLFAQFTYMTGFLARNYMYYDGSTVLKSARNVQVTQANRWRNPGDVTNVAKYSTDRTEFLYQILDHRFDKGDFLKCNNISLGYNLPPDVCKKIRLNRARININALNVFTITKFRGIDPETKGNYGYPSARSYKLSLSIGF